MVKLTRAADTRLMPCCAKGPFVAYRKGRCNVDVGLRRKNSNNGNVAEVRDLIATY